MREAVGVKAKKSGKFHPPDPDLIEARAVASREGNRAPPGFPHRHFLRSARLYRPDSISDTFTQNETVEFILGKLRDRGRFSVRAMFGEYALYADGKVVALVCDDLLYVKILPASNELEGQCEKAEPYPGANPHYIVEEGQLSTIARLPAILCDLAESIPEKKKKPNRKRTS
jgi:DNA transformation protein